MRTLPGTVGLARGQTHYTLSTMLCDSPVLEILPDSTVDNRRNSEGSFSYLNDGRILFVYTRFQGDGGDAAEAEIVGRFSSDNGQSWNEKDITLVTNEGACNVMSASLLSLQDGRLALFYLRKEEQGVECRLQMRISQDNAESWSQSTCCVTAPGKGYFVTNNDRVIQLQSGRLLAPANYGFLKAAQSAGGKTRRSAQHARFFYSDDAGDTWYESQSSWTLPVPSGSGMQESGVVELKDGRLFGWARTDTGCQWGHYSSDGGITWTPPAPTVFTGPLAPLSIKRIPSTGDLLAIWNHHSSRYQLSSPEPGSAGRTPLVAAISRDDGVTWHNHQLLEADPQRAYTYPAVYPTTDEHILIAYGTGINGVEGLRQRIRRLPVQAFYPDR